MTGPTELTGTTVVTVLTEQMGPTIDTVLVLSEPPEVAIATLLVFPAVIIEVVATTLGPCM